MLADWNEVTPLKDVPKHDIVVSSRSAGLWDIDKLSSLAVKLVAIIIWRYGCPSIPAIANMLFDGVGVSPNNPPFGVKDRRLGDNVWYNRVYDMGYDVNMRILDDGYTRTYNTREDAYADLTRLYKYMRGEEIPLQDIERFRQNVDKNSSINSDGGVTFLIPTGSIMLWWKPQKYEL
jgi:hypothetical protein